jgi:hypothetical protein
MTFIAGLADPIAAIRERAAGEIFKCGRELARSAIGDWLADESLARRFVMNALQFPEATVGVAVKPPTFESIWKACGSPRLPDVPPDQDAREFELEFANGIRLDILTTREPEGLGAMARHLQKFGESIQQVELLVKNVDETTEILRARFHLTPVFPKTRAGANGTRVNFFLVAAPDGRKVLIEIVEAAASTQPLC